MSAPSGCCLEGAARVQIDSSADGKNIDMSRLEGSAGVELGRCRNAADASYLVGLETGLPDYVMPSVPLLVKARRSRDELVSRGVAQMLGFVRHHRVFERVVTTTAGAVVRKVPLQTFG